MPAYRGSAKYMTLRYDSAAAAIATGGSFFFGGAFDGWLDFGTPAAPDVRMSESGDADGFITKFNADGSSAWTRTIPNSGGVDIFGREAQITINSLAAMADGGVVAVGSYSGTIDLDPGDAVEVHQTMGFAQRETFVVKLAADGSFAWGGTFASQGGYGNTEAVATDGAGAVYVSDSAGMLVKLTPAGKMSWVHSSSDKDACVPSGGSMALATDGMLWIAGGNREGLCPAGALIAAYRPDGALYGYLGFATTTDSSIAFRSIAAGPNNSVYVGGSAWGFPDFDPGPGVTRRLVGTVQTGGRIDPGGFIIKVGSDGTYLWDQTLGGGDVIALAGAPDGGVIALGSLGVMKLNADGTAGWTFQMGQFPGTVASSGNVFVVTGSVNYETDVNPGLGADIVLGANLYLARFTF
jgi:hypothetical protein